MRIISKFKDYYDKVQSLGIDNDLVFVREMRTISANDRKGDSEFREEYRHLKFGNAHLSPRQMLTGTGSLPVEKVYVFFCGKVSVVYLYKGLWGKFVVPFTDLGKLFTAIESGELAAKELELRLEDVCDTGLANFTYPMKDHQIRCVSLVKKFRERKPNGYDQYPFNPEGWSRYLERVGDLHVKTSDQTHLHFSTPIVSFHDSIVQNETKIVINPNIGELGFAKFFSPPVAFQEISTYLGNNLAKQMDPVPVRTQELIRDAHGFDDKSFKSTAPGERKLRRKVNKEEKKSKREQKESI